MAGWTKLEKTILQSSIWDEPNHVRIVWITLLALQDKDGYVGASVPGIAHEARVSKDEAQHAIETLESPDPWSRDPDNEGRRIEKVDRGWLILNSKKIRGEDKEEKIRRQTRERVAKHRAKKKNVTQCNVTVTPVTQVTHNKNKNKNKKGEYEGEDLIPLSAALLGESRGGKEVSSSQESSGGKESISPLLALSPTPVTDITSISKSNGKKKPKRKRDPTTPGSAIFDAYAEGYFAVYKKAPIRNGRVNSLCKQLHALLGADGPAVARYYPTTRSKLYVQSGHALQLLVRDAEKLHTEWSTGIQITAAISREADNWQTTQMAINRVVEELGE